MATVIKAGESGQVVRRLATVDLADHLREAQSVINEARARAAAMIHHAQGEVVRMHDSARAQGQREGHAEGWQKGRAQGFEAAHSAALTAFQTRQESLVSAMSAAVTALEAVKADLEIAAQRDLLEFAMAVAVKLTFAIGKGRREAAAENLRRALALVGTQTRIAIRVNPMDRDAMAEFAPRLIEQLGVAQGISVEADADIAAGGCRVHTPHSDVDATLETQTAELVRLMLGAPSSVSDASCVEGGA